MNRFWDKEIRCSVEHWNFRIVVFLFLFCFFSRLGSHVLLVNGILLTRAFLFSPRRRIVARGQMAASFSSPAQNATGWTASMWCSVSASKLSWNFQLTWTLCFTSEARFSTLQCLNICPWTGSVILLSFQAKWWTVCSSWEKLRWASAFKSEHDPRGKQPEICRQLFRLLGYVRRLVF